jgi:hypothetical protein
MNNRLLPKNSLLRCAALTALVLPLAAFAGHRKPGLWQNTVQINFTKGGPQIPAAQLEKMKQMGIDLPFNRPMTTKHCLTAADAEKDDHPDFGKEKECQVKNAAFSGNTFSADLVCNSPDMQGTGNVKATFTSDTAYSGTMHFAGTSAHMGGQVEMNNQFSGQWLSSDCGDVKGVQMR